MALAVLAALVAAMFIALQSVSAAALGACNTTGPTNMGIGDTCTITLNAAGVSATSSDAAVAADTSDGTIEALALGTATFTDPAVEDDTGTENVDESEPERTYTIVVKKVAVSKIEFGSLVDQQETPSETNLTDDTFIADTDSTFAAGTDVHVRVTSSFSSGDSVAFTVSAPTTGLSLSGVDPTATGTVGNTTQRKTSTNTNAARDAAMVTVKSRSGDFILVTDGAPDGDYTITATANDGTNTSVKFSATLTIGDAGNAVDSATLALGLREGFLTPLDATDDKPESGSDSQTGEVNLVLSITNAIGSPVNASDVDEIRVVAPFGEVSYLSDGAFTSVTDNTIPGSALSKGAVIVQIGSSNDVARAIDVYAIALGTVSGVATTDPVSLSFTGPAEAMIVADATKTLRNVNVETDADDNLVDDTITLLVSATDKGGNTARPPLGLGLTITDPDGVAVSSDNIRADQPAQGKDGLWRITVTNVSGDSVAAALKTGEYTLNAKSGDIGASATFTVAGAATSVSVSVDDMAPSAYGTVTATAMVTDKDGAIAADDTSVDFTSSDPTILKEVGDTAAKNTKDGSASQQFAVVGPGVALIIANVGDVSDVAVIQSTAGSTAAADEEASVACLSSLSGFATWSCGVESSASEIFGLVSGRGATALHLWNGSSWVRYSVVDGSMVPGSSDFMVTENDILYISN